MSTTDLDAWLGLVRAYHRVAARIDDTMQKRDDACLTWFEVLTGLIDQPVGVRVSELASRVTISQPRVSRVLGLMEERGLVRRSSVPGDARGTEVELTEAGVRLYHQARATYEEILGETVLARLGPAELGSLRQLGAVLDDQPA